VTALPEQKVKLLAIRLAVGAAVLLTTLAVAVAVQPLVPVTVTE
jgi:hypothetical protein